jgi:hypothetical protein
MPPIAPIGSSTPSVQPLNQIQGTVNPGLNANQISLATPPASFSQGKRFFLEANNGSFELKTLNSDGPDGLSPHANPEITGDALEVNASIAYAITTGAIAPGSYMAQHTAQTIRLNDAVKRVGSSPLQPPSLAGEITGDKFDASAILQFLKKSKGQLDDSNVKAEISSHNQDLVCKTLLVNLQQALATIDSNPGQILTLQTQLAAEQAKQTPDQTVIDSLNNQISTLTTGLASARTSAEEIGASLFASNSMGGLRGIKKDLDKLQKDQLTKIDKVVTTAVTKSITDQIDQALLRDDPVANLSISPLVQTADGVVIKTPQAQTKEALLGQIQSAEFKADLAQSIIENADALGLGQFTTQELKNIATVLAQYVSDTMTSDTTIIDEAINNSDALLSDVSNILNLELEGQSGRSTLPHNV